MSCRIRRFIALYGVVLSLVTVAFAGDLEPPAGPVRPTMRNLDHVEPRIPLNSDTTPGDEDAIYRIIEPGSYYLTGNINGVAGRHGIEIAASNVSIDLMGFSVSGGPNSLSGIRTSVIADNITICNGSITGWGASGIVLNDPNIGNGCLIEKIHASSNGTDGIKANNSAIIRFCVAVGNGVGIVAFENALIESCNTRDNSSNGILVASGSVVRSCVGRENSANGIAVGNGSTVVDCTTVENGGDGIVAGVSANITTCTSYFNDGDGIFADNGSIVTGCTSHDNGGDGIFANSSSVVSNCTVSFNIGDGIEVDDDAVVRNNVADSNGFSSGNAAGIHVTGVDTRVEGNVVNDNDRGIDIDFAGNILFGNTASGNGVNYEIVANNIVGVIVQAPTSGAISGSTGGTGVGASNAWINISY